MSLWTYLNIWGASSAHFARARHACTTYLDANTAALIFTGQSYKLARDLYAPGRKQQLDRYRNKSRQRLTGGRSGPRKWVVCNVCTIYAVLEKLSDLSWDHYTMVVTLISHSWITPSCCSGVNTWKYSWRKSHISHSSQCSRLFSYSGNSLIYIRKWFAVFYSSSCLRVSTPGWSKINT